MEGFLEKLIELRIAFGQPMNINSGCRCPEHNSAVGGVKRSFHLFDSAHTNGIPAACAVDVRIWGWSAAKRENFLKLARARGWSVGVAKSFIHIDRRTDYPAAGWSRRAEWTY